MPYRNSGRTCLEPDCQQQSLSRGLCRNHYQNARNHGTVNQYPKLLVIRTGCSVTGCRRLHEGRGLCNMHYRRAWRSGTLEQYSTDDVTSEEPKARPNPGLRVCSIPECNSKHWAKGLCTKHYSRSRSKKKTTGRSPRSQRGCSVPECGSEHCSRGLCSRHYARVKSADCLDMFPPTRGGRVGCSESDCTEKHYGRGLCRRHWEMARRRGTVSQHPSSDEYFDPTSTRRRLAEALQASHQPQ